MKLSVVIPCYNEEQNVQRIVPELFPVLDALDCDTEIILVDDGSADGTLRTIKNIHRSEIVIVEHGVNKGLGAAVRSGIAAATGDLLIVLDGDFTFHPRLIPDLIKAKHEHGVDFVIGSPYLGHFDSAIPRWRLWISTVANVLYGFLLGKKIKAINTIFRLYKTADLKKIPLEAVGFDINAEILFKLVFSGKLFSEIPAALTQRKYGESKLNYIRETRRHVILIFRILTWKIFGF